ncbi:uncharacterized protein LOC144862290 [Branchiostoma floridae x Branchiostoma japonicum]
MEKLLLFIACISVWPALSQGQQYVVSEGGWAFHKVFVTGAMTNTNVKTTCEGAGMSFPCYYSDDQCQSGVHWTDDCISYTAVEGECRTPFVLANALCGASPNHGASCRPLDDIFVYYPYRAYGDSAWGTDYDTTTYGLNGEDFNDKFALCADYDSCASSPCHSGGTCEDRLYGYSCYYSDGGQYQNETFTVCEPDPCQNGGSCHVHNQGQIIHCTCAAGFLGEFCENSVVFDDPCDPNPCPFNWPCTVYGISSHCSVPVVHRKSSYCSDSPCGSGWNCREEGPTGFSCIRG